MLLNNNLKKEKIFVNNSERIICGSSSKGNQRKWFSNGKFIKADTWKWYESVSEILVSRLLQFSDVKYYVKYYPCEIYEDNSFVGEGCYSENFLNAGESDITFSRLLKNYGISIDTISYEETRDAISDIIGFDIKAYLDRCLCIDAITFNEDRHLNNLSVIKTKTGYRESPVYDNGLACLSDVFSYPLELSLQENLQKVYAMPFDTDFIRQLEGRFIRPIVIDKEGFLNDINVNNIEEKRALDVITFGLERTKGVAWEEG